MKESIRNLFDLVPDDITLDHVQNWNQRVIDFVRYNTQ
jgi:hypothetical protein